MSIGNLGRAGMLALMALAMAGCTQFGPMLGGQEKARPHPRADGAKPRTQRAQVNRPATPDPRRDDADSRAALREGIALFDKGDYNGAIRRLSGSDMNGAGQRERLTALKYTAFSYCVTGRQTLCRQTFERAFKLDDSFDLDQGEHGHPQWGPVFTQARQAATR